MGETYQSAKEECITQIKKLWSDYLKFEAMEDMEEEVGMLADTLNSLCDKLKTMVSRHVDEDQVLFEHLRQIDAKLYLIRHGIDEEKKKVSTLLEIMESGEEDSDEEPTRIVVFNVSAAEMFKRNDSVDTLQKLLGIFKKRASQMRLIWVASDEDMTKPDDVDSGEWEKYIAVFDEFSAGDWGIVEKEMNEVLFSIADAYYGDENEIAKKMRSLGKEMLR